MQRQQPTWRLPPVANASGVLTVGAGGGVVGGPDVLVGLNGNGTLEINGGGMIASQVRIGVNSGSTGVATVTGAGSTLFPTSLFVGIGGTGVLNGAVHVWHSFVGFLTRVGAHHL